MPDEPAAPGPDAPDLKIAADTPAEQCPPTLLFALRDLNDQINALKARQNDLMAGYMAGRGWSPSTHRMNINIDTGTVTATPVGE